MLNRSSDERMLNVVGINLPEIITKINDTNESIRNLSNTMNHLKFQITDFTQIIDKFSKSSDKQSNRIFCLTIAIAIASFLNIGAVVFQTLYNN